MVKLQRNFLSSSVCVLLSIYIVYCVYYIHLRTQNENKHHTKKVKSYDARITGHDGKRLGFAVKPEFQILPKTFNDILHELKIKHYQTTKPPSDISSTTVLDQNKYFSHPTIKTLQILVETGNGWGNYNEMNYCKKNKNPEFRCNFTDFPELKNSHNSSTELEIKEVAGNFDAVFVYRDWAHKQYISLNSDATYFQSNDTSPKLVYFTLEAPGPPHNWQMDVTRDGRLGRSIFASYWRGSDIYTPYFTWKYYDPSITAKRQKRNYAKGRSKMAAIVVSNCLPNNNRMGLVQELRRYFEVDTFGKCGETECRITNCFRKIRKNYKFYLSFENSNCRDYITEKLLKGYENDLLPIVMGAHPVDYKTIAPKNSYIHIENFDSVEELAKYLTLLDKDDALYNSYFAWKGTGKFLLYGQGFMCELCSYLHVQNILAAAPAHDQKEIQNTIRNVRSSGSNSVQLPYFNFEDSYDFKTFNFSDNDTRLCLKSNLWYWNR